MPWTGSCFHSCTQQHVCPTADTIQGWQWTHCHTTRAPSSTTQHADSMPVCAEESHTRYTCRMVRNLPPGEHKRNTGRDENYLYSCALCLGSSLKNLVLCDCNTDYSLFVSIIMQNLHITCLSWDAFLHGQEMRSTEHFISLAVIVAASINIYKRIWLFKWPGIQDPNSLPLSPSSRIWVLT